MGQAIAEKRGLAAYYLGCKQRAKFIGHGVGLELNETPVLAPGFKTPLEAGMALAIEPKFILPDIGAAGIENTYLVTPSGLERLTACEEGIARLA